MSYDPSPGRKTKNPKMEEQLVQWYNEAIKRNINITAKMIRDKAAPEMILKDIHATADYPQSPSTYI